jgi:hypothetical protein
MMCLRIRKPTRAIFKSNLAYKLSNGKTDQLRRKCKLAAFGETAKSVSVSTKISKVQN